MRIVHLWFLKLKDHGDQQPARRPRVAWPKQTQPTGWVFLFVVILVLRKLIGGYSYSYE